MEYLSLTEACKIVPSRPAACSLWRWCRKGVKTRDGGRVYLQHVRIGGKVYTTRDWLDAFFRETAEADNEHFRSKDTRPAKMPKGRTSKQRDAAVAQANRDLRDAGI